MSRPNFIKVPDVLLKEEGFDEWCSENNIHVTKEGYFYSTLEEHTWMDIDVFKNNFFEEGIDEKVLKDKYSAFSSNSLYDLISVRFEEHGIKRVRSRKRNLYLDIFGDKKKLYFWTVQINKRGKAKYTDGTKFYVLRFYSVPRVILKKLGKNRDVRISLVQKPSGIRIGKFD